MIASVLVELSNKNIDKTFDYIIPLRFIDKVKVGIRVTVSFGSQTLEGFVLEIKDTVDTSNSLKEIIDVVDTEVILNDELLGLGKYISETTLSTLIAAYQVMLPKALKAKNGTVVNKKIDKYIVLNKSKEELANYKLNDKQMKIIDILQKEKEVKKNLLTLISVSSINTLLQKGIILETYKEDYRLVNSVLLKEKYPLTKEQEIVVKEVLEGKPSTYLLHGVTGSGKTEVYMEIIEEELKKGKSSIVLVPEISLTQQIVERFRSRFGDEIAILHSRLSDGEKYDEYRKIRQGEVHIVIGARSAVFAPLTNIGVIIVDEEHTTSYKQENNPKYSAIDIAIKRSEYHNCSVILGSATPMLETYARGLKGVYKLLELKTRVNNRQLPEVKIVNMSEEIKCNSNYYFSSSLINNMKNVFEKGEQVILLLNRRGYSSFVSCNSCGEAIKCPNCDITLTYHKTSNTLRCHYCGYGTKVSDTCPNCHDKSLTNLGTGTEKIEEEITKIFPEKKIIRMDFDTTSKKGSHEKIVKAFENHEYDILLGTQMIAKGLDFPNVTLVGVINADTSLNIPDFRSSEYTFQLLDQVSGRSGRGEKAGNVIIQTFNPDHYAIKYVKNHDYVGFYNEEMKIRRQLGYPPYFYLTSVKIMSSNYDEARDISNKVGDYLKKNLTNTTVLGPAVGSPFKINNIYRFQIILKYKSEKDLYKVLNELVEHYKSNQKIKIDIDFNPNHF